MDTEKSINQKTDQEVLNEVVPAYARALNWLYEHSFGPLDRFVDHLRGASTRQMIADFDAAEARKGS
jgi:hypothetical protein